MEEDTAAVSGPQAPIWHGLVAGALSGVTARLFTFPTDTLKARMQVQGALAGKAQHNLPHSGFWATSKHMWRSEGPGSFYRGFSAVMWGVVPANIAYFGGYEVGKRCIPADWGIGGDMAIGAVAQVLAGVIYTPIDVVKERMQVQGIMKHAYSYKNAAAAFSALQSGASGVTGLFKGYWVTNSVWLPWNTLYIAAYEQLKLSACGALGCSQVQELPPWSVASCSAVAAAAAAVVTHPADVVKTRLQVLSATAAGRELTARSLARQMLADEGTAVFWQGLSARVLNIAPGCAISWMMFESIKKQLLNSS